MIREISEFEMAERDAVVASEAGDQTARGRPRDAAMEYLKAGLDQTSWIPFQSAVLKQKNLTELSQGGSLACLPPPSAALNHALHLSTLQLDSVREEELFHQSMTASASLQELHSNSPRRQAILRQSSLSRSQQRFPPADLQPTLPVSLAMLGERSAPSAASLPRGVSPQPGPTRLVSGSMTLSVAPGPPVVRMTSTARGESPCPISTRLTSGSMTLSAALGAPGITPQQRSLVRSEQHLSLSSSVRQISTSSSSAFAPVPRVSVAGDLSALQHQVQVRSSLSSSSLSRSAVAPAARVAASPTRQGMSLIAQAAQPQSSRATARGGAANTQHALIAEPKPEVKVLVVPWAGAQPVQVQGISSAPTEIWSPKVRTPSTVAPGSPGLPLTPRQGRPTLAGPSSPQFSPLRSGVRSEAPAPIQFPLLSPLQRGRHMPSPAPSPVSPAWRRTLADVAVPGATPPASTLPVSSANFAWQPHNSTRSPVASASPYPMWAASPVLTTRTQVMGNPSGLSPILPLKQPSLPGSLVLPAQVPDLTPGRTTEARPPPLKPQGPLLSPTSVDGGSVAAPVQAGPPTHQSGTPGRGLGPVHVDTEVVVPVRAAKQLNGLEHGLIFRSVSGKSLTPLLSGRVPPFHR